MAMLTASQLTRLRDLTGGRTTSEDDDHLTDDELQDEYDAASGSWDLGIVYVLQRRVGMAARAIDKSLDLNSQSLSQYVDHLRDLLKDAELRAGVTPGRITVGKLKLNINTKLDDIQ